MRTPTTKWGLGLLLVAGLFTSGCGFYQEMPVAPANIPGGGGEYESLRPEDMCAKVRDGAFDVATRDTILGSVFSVLGAAGTTTGTALALRDGQSKTAVGEWSAVAGASAALVAAGVYFFVQGGQDRTNYWRVNATLAHMRAKRHGLPYKLRTTEEVAELNTIADTAEAAAVRAEGEVTAARQCEADKQKQCETEKLAVCLKDVKQESRDAGTTETVKLEDVSCMQNMQSKCDAEKTALCKVANATGSATAAHGVAKQAKLNATKAAAEQAADQAAWEQCAGAFDKIADGAAASSTQFTGVVSKTVK
jgi:hypothetical protein